MNEGFASGVVSTVGVGAGALATGAVIPARAAASCEIAAVCASILASRASIACFAVIRVVIIAPPLAVVKSGQEGRTIRPPFSAPSLIKERRGEKGASHKIGGKDRP